MTRVLMDMNLSNVRDNHKHVGSNLELVLRNFVLDICSRQS